MHNRTSRTPRVIFLFFYFFFDPRNHVETAQTERALSSRGQRLTITVYLMYTCRDAKQQLSRDGLQTVGSEVIRHKSAHCTW